MHIQSMPSIACCVRKIRAEIYQPASTSDLPIKLTAGLAASVTMEATVHNLEDTSSVCVLVRLISLFISIDCPAGCLL